jgi:hypothetical protein
MSDSQVRSALEQMEAWLADVNWEPDPEALARWNEAYQAALAQAERGPGWADLIARAHAAGRAMEARTVIAIQERDRLKAALESQERGARALKGYGAGTR